MSRNKKVCIETWYGTANYGTCLQSYALAEVLKKMGCDVSFMGQFRVYPFFIRHPVMLYARIKNKLDKKKTKAFFDPVPYELTEKRKERLAEFKSRTYKTKTIKSSAEWKKTIREKTVFVAGSDILWNPARGYPEKPFLDFAYYAGLNRFSYASSVGALKLPKKYYKAYKRYLGSMKAVGVREESVKKMLEPIIGREVRQVVDPTLLLTADDWSKFAGKAELSVEPNKDGFIVCYFVMNDPRYWDYVKLISETCKKQIIVLPMHKIDEQQPYDVVLDGTAPEFVWLIKNADFVCTDSFHACVVSSLFKKEFYLLRRTRKSENAKYDDFLNKYGLSGRSVTDESVFERKQEIDYSAFVSRIQQDRDNALQFLRSALKESEGNNK